MFSLLLIRNIIKNGGDFPALMRRLCQSADPQIKGLERINLKSVFHPSINDFLLLFQVFDDVFTSDRKDDEIPVLVSKKRKLKREYVGLNGEFPELAGSLLSQWNDTERVFSLTNSL